MDLDGNSIQFQRKLESLKLLDRQRQQDCSNSSPCSRVSIFGKQDHRIKWDESKLKIYKEIRCKNGVKLYVKWIN